MRRLLVKKEIRKDDSRGGSALKSAIALLPLLLLVALILGWPWITRS